MAFNVVGFLGQLISNMVRDLLIATLEVSICIFSLYLIHYLSKSFKR